MPAKMLTTLSASMIPSKNLLGTWSVWLQSLYGRVLSAQLCFGLSTERAFSGKLSRKFLNLTLYSVDEYIEIRGLDIKKHGEPAYPTAAYGHGWDAEGDFRMSSK